MMWTDYMYQKKEEEETPALGNLWNTETRKIYYNNKNNRKNN